MGRGKTMIITPLIILNKYLKKQNNCNIIIPKHLVLQSFDIHKNNNLMFLLKIKIDLNINIENNNDKKNIYNIDFKH